MVVEVVDVVDDVVLDVDAVLDVEDELDDELVVLVVDELDVLVVAISYTYSSSGSTAFGVSSNAPRFIPLSINASISSLPSTATYTSGVWTHVVLTYSVSDGGRKYINGVADLTGGGGLSGSFRVNIGGYNNGASFNGDIDDVRFYDTVLSQSDVDEIFNLGNGTEVSATGNVGSTHQVVATSSSYVSPHSLDSLADLAVEGELEVGGDAWVDGTLILGNPLDVPSGGTGLATLTDGGIVLGSGTNAVTVLAQATNGQIPVGSTGTDPVLATLTGTANQITVTNGAGSITLSTPQDIATISSPTFATLTTTAGRIYNTTRATTTYQILVTDHVVFCNTDASAWTATLPAGAEGQTLRVINSGSSGNDLTLAPDGAEHLLGANSNFTLRDGESLMLTYNATDGWY